MESVSLKLAILKSCYKLPVLKATLSVFESQVFSITFFLKNRDIMIVMAAIFLRDQPTFVELLGDNQNNG